MSRYTQKMFEADIEQTNLNLAASGSNVYFWMGSVSGYTEIWKGFVTETGIRNTCSRLEIGTPRECLVKMQKESGRETGVIRGPAVSDSFKATRAMAVGVMSGFVKMDVPQDFHALRSEMVDILLAWAKPTKYRQPASASGSTGRSFFTHLQNKAAKPVSA